MSLCREVGRWITENVEQPVELFFEQAREQCEEARRWVEREIRRPVQRVREEQQEQCRKQECNPWCLCCNKWFCWIVTVIVTFIEWIIEIVGEWLVETVCKLIVEIIRVIVIVIIEVTRWVVEAIVCIVEKFCEYLYFVTGIAIIAVLVGLILAAGALVVPGGLPALLAGAAAAIGGLLLATLLCERSACRLLRVLAWAFKWAVVLGMAIAVAALNVVSAFVVVLLGGVASALIRALHDRNCPIPRLLGWP